MPFYTRSEMTFMRRECRRHKDCGPKCEAKGKCVRLKEGSIPARWSDAHIKYYGIETGGKNE